jgi:hypothetical protein
MAKKTTRKIPPENTSAPNDRATQYAREVVAGRIVTGRLVRMACQRHLDDLKRADIFFDAAAANRAIGFYEDVLRLAGGEFEGRPFILQAWQCFIVGSLFGWKMPDGFRRFNWSYCEIGKGNGKSPLAGGVGLYMLTAVRRSRNRQDSKNGGGETEVCPLRALYRIHFRKRVSTRGKQRHAMARRRPGKRRLLLQSRLCTANPADGHENRGRAK